MGDIVWLSPATVAAMRSASELDDSDIVSTPWGGVVDLAAPRASKAKIPPPPPSGVMGSDYDRYRIYAYYQDGIIYESGPVETADIEDMLAKDGTARALEQALTLPLRGLDWEIKPAKGDKGELAFVMDALTTPPEMGGMDIPLQIIIGQMTSAVLFKRAHFEKCFTDPAQSDDGKVRYQKLAYRPPMTCYLARSAQDASFAGFMQWSWKGQQFVKILIPAKKSFVYIHGQHRNPLEGITDMDVAYQCWTSKQKLRFLWYQFLETQASPRTVAKHSTNDENEAAALAQKVATLKGGGVVGLVTGQDVGVIESNGQGATEYMAAIAYLDSQMATSVLAGFLNLTQQAHVSSRGSNALSQSQVEFFLQSREGVAKEMESALTHQVISDLVRYNFGADAACPTFNFGDLKESDSTDKAIALLQAIAVAPSISTIPFGFIDLLTEKVAAYLDIDADAVHEAITGQSHDASETPAELAAANAPPQPDIHSVIANAAGLVAAHDPGGAPRVNAPPGLGPGPVPHPGGGA